jgi:hypothetical protein
LHKISNAYTCADFIDQQLNSVLLQIWAAGFTAAILKKRSSTITTEPNSPIKEEDASTPQKKEPLGIENIMLSSLEKLFPIFLNHPDVNT